MNPAKFLTGEGQVLFSEIGLLLSMAAFAVVVYLTYRRQARAEQDRGSLLPLEDDEAPRAAARKEANHE